MEVNMGRHLGIDFSRILMDFGAQVGQENRPKRVMMMVLIQDDDDDGDHDQIMIMIMIKTKMMVRGRF